VLSNVGLNITINYYLEEAISLLLNGGLRKTTNRCLVEVLILLLSGGLRKNTNQFGGFGLPQTKSCSLVTDRLIGL
jgi:hypothetical protein